MDSRIVNREIKREVWPLLREQGFKEFSSKTAWRYAPEQIHVVQFSSCNSYIAEGVGCTTFSFGVALGAYIRVVPRTYQIVAGKDPTVRPQNYHCHFRHFLKKRIEQAALPRKDVWYVEPDGCNVLDVLADAREVLKSEGLPWFDQFNSLERVMDQLIEEERLLNESTSRSSPMAKHIIGHIARHLGVEDVAESMMAAAASQFEANRLLLSSIGRKRRSKAGPEA